LTRPGTAAHAAGSSSRRAARPAVPYSLRARPCCTPIQRQLITPWRLPTVTGNLPTDGHWRLPGGGQRITGYHRTLEVRGTRDPPICAARRPAAGRPVPPTERTICCRRRRSAAARSAGARQRLATAYSAPAGHARPVSDANASTVSAAARARPVMTALGLGDGSGQPGPDPRRARSRAFSRLSAMPWA